MWAGQESVRLFHSVLLFVFLPYPREKISWWEIKQQNYKGQELGQSHWFTCKTHKQPISCFLKPKTTQAISDLQCYGHLHSDEFTRFLCGNQVCLSRPQSLYIAPWPIAAGSSYLQPAPLLTPLHAEPLAGKGCRGRWHGWMSHQYKQTEQRWISPPEISQQIKVNLEKYSDGNTVMLLRAVPAHSTYLAPSAPLNPMTWDIWCFGWAVARTWWTTGTAPKEGTLSESHVLQKPPTKKRAISATSVKFITLFTQKEQC